jgi:hypothetical protein
MFGIPLPLFLKPTPKIFSVSSGSVAICKTNNRDKRCAHPTELEAVSKVKQSRYTPWRRLGGEEYSSSFTTSALDGDEWSASRPDRTLLPEKGPPVPIVQEAGWAPEPVLTQRLEEKSFASAGDRTPIARSSSS